MDIKKYDNIRLESADNGIEVSFNVVKESMSEETFAPMNIRRKEFVFQYKDIADAFKLVEDLVYYNMKKKKGEDCKPVKLPY